jgi:hypothetical protein
MLSDPAFWHDAVIDNLNEIAKTSKETAVDRQRKCRIKKRKALSDPNHPNHEKEVQKRKANLIKDRERKKRKRLSIANGTIEGLGEKLGSGSEQALVDAPSTTVEQSPLVSPVTHVEYEPTSVEAASSTGVFAPISIVEAPAVASSELTPHPEPTEPLSATANLAQRIENELTTAFESANAEGKLNQGNFHTAQ